MQNSAHGSAGVGDIRDVHTAIDTAGQVLTAKRISDPMALTDEAYPDEPGIHSSEQRPGAAEIARQDMPEARRRDANTPTGRP